MIYSGGHKLECSSGVRLMEIFDTHEKSFFLTFASLNSYLFCHQRRFSNVRFGSVAALERHSGRKAAFEGKVDVQTSSI